MRWVEGGVGLGARGRRPIRRDRKTLHPDGVTAAPLPLAAGPAITGLTRQYDAERRLPVIEPDALLVQLP